MIDRLIESASINIPPTEIRQAKQSISSSKSGSKCAISALGIRSNEASPIPNMAEAIWTAYSDAESLTELSWRALKAAGPATPGTILQYLNTKTPMDAINDLVFTSSDITQELRDFVISDLDAAQSATELSKKMLWKLGIDVPRFGTEHTDIFRNLDSFRDALLERSEPLSVNDREIIRSAGVNLFVNLENFLENLISYNVWVLKNDHYMSRFVYDPSIAMNCVVDTIYASDAGLWNGSGGNTLGVLVSYLANTAKWMETLVRGKALCSERPASAYPHYASSGDPLFPFHNLDFWANCDQSELARYTSGFADIANAILRSGLAEVRNGLDHYRRPEKFPSLDQMLSCEMRIRQSVQASFAKNYFPKCWWMTKRIQNYFGQYEETYTDQAGKLINLTYPMVLVGIREFTFAEAVAIPHGNLLGQANSSLLFKYVEHSEYTKMWENYPFRNVDNFQVEENPPTPYDFSIKSNKDLSL